MAQEEAYLDQEGRQPPTGPANLTTSPASPGPSSQQTPHANPSTLGRAAGSSHHDIEVYGTILNTLSDDMKTLIHKKNASENKDICEHTNPSYPHCRNKVNNHSQNRYHNLDKTLETVTLDQLPGSLRIRDR